MHNDKSSQRKNLSKNNVKIIVALIIFLLLIITPISAVPTNTSIIGFRWDTSSDSSALSQINSAGTVVTVPASFWEDSVIWGNMKTVVVASNGTIFYGSNNRGDGLTLDGTQGDVMVEIPKFWTCSTYSNPYFYYYISPVATAGYEVAPMFNQRMPSGVTTPAPYFYVARYDANDGGSSKLQSATGKAPYVSQTIETFRTMAENKGSGWGITNIWTLSGVRQLFYTEMLTLNSQTAWANSRGIVDAAAAKNSGADSADSNIYAINATGGGTGTNGQTPVVYRGMENVWGNIYQFQDGFNAVQGTTNIITKTGFNSSGGRTTFKDLMFATDVDNVGALLIADGYQSNLMNTDASRGLFLPSSVTGGVDSKYLADYYYYPRSTNAAAPNILLSGGSWGSAGLAGLGFLTAFNGASASYASVGARLEFRPTIPVSYFTSDFTASNWSGLAPLTVAFVESSFGKIPDSYYWDFGDGGSDTIQNPTHIYNSIGIYNVNHRVINGSITIWNNKTAYIHANRTVEANFTGTPTSGYLNPGTMPVSFTDTSLGEGISQWTWNFGDGSSNATTQNPSHNYATVGTFNVFLKVWGADGNSSITKTGYITVNPLVADFTTNKVTTSLGLPIVFNDTSIGYPSSWYWDFGDGSTSTLRNTSYSYSAVGTYTVKFKVSNSVETRWKNVTNLITITSALPPTPVTDFIAIPVSAPIGTSIHFYDQSGNVPTSWLWEFGDGATSVSQNPVHAYAVAGLYTVNLTATNSLGSNTLSKTNYVTITSPLPPVAAFSASSTSSYVGGTITFTDESLYTPTSWLYNFGDGTTSTLQNPSHTYSAAGTYTVSLLSTNPYGSDTETKIGYITISGTVPTIPPSSYVITNPATEVSNNTVTMNGYTQSSSYKYYFEYGLYPGVYAYATAQQTGTSLDGNFTETVSGLPLMSDETYYYRAVINENNKYTSGEELSYDLTQAPTLDMYPEFETRGEALVEANWNFDTFLTVIPSPFVDTMGSIFYGIIIGGAFILLWARTHKIIIPAFFGILSGGVLWNILPPSWVAFGSTLFYISIAGFLYGIIVGRQS